MARKDHRYLVRYCPGRHLVNMIKNIDIVCLSSLDWDAHWTSKQQIMNKLAACNRVLYVEEPVTMLAPLIVASRWKRWRAVLPSLRQVGPTLWILTPPPLLPFGNKRPSLNRVNQAILARYVRWAMKKLSFTDRHILWTYLPANVAVLDRLYRVSAGKPPSLVLYHCVDEHSAFPGHFMSPEIVKAYDDELTRRADLVITTSVSLGESRKALNPHTYTVFNAADVELFNQALDPMGPVPADLDVIPSPRIGVVGVHDYRLDVDALVRLVRADPSWQVVLIGPLRVGHLDEARLRALPGMHLLGDKAREELPSYLRGLDVALIPYKTCELTRNIFPLKLFEYLAAGLPVVAGGLPELKRYAGTVALADRVEEYPALVRAAIAGDSPEKRDARVALAADNSWDHRLTEISALVEAALKRKPQQQDALQTPTAP
jgi:glycosyltransferase involved in cell wall biosynthesis